jgi:glycosyltransferase involved in cell wall biosynthesis
MVEFFAAGREIEPRLRFEILTQGDPAPVAAEFRRLGITPEAFSIRRVTPEQVAEYLVAADAAISFIRPCFSKVSSSPTKIGEYLAGGLPIVSSAGIGDVDELLRSTGTGVLVEEFKSEAYRAAAVRLRVMADDAAVREACVRAATERLSLTGVGIPAYDAVYRALAHAVTA